MGILSQIGYKRIILPAKILQLNNKKNLLINPFSDQEKEGEWRNYYTNELVDLNLGENSYSNDTLWNCAHVRPWALQGWREYSCFVPDFMMCGCQHPNQMYLQLRGLCPGSHIDRFYAPRDGPHILIHLKQWLLFSL